MCASLACGGGYRVFLNDVWMSADAGVTWTQVVAQAPWAARADHTAFSDGVRLWLLAGRGGVNQNYSYNPMFGDMWNSPDGGTWTLNATSSPWGPRASARAVYGQDTQYDARNQPSTVQHVLLVGGEQVVLPSPSPSPLVIAAQVTDAAYKALDGKAVREGGAPAYRSRCALAPCDLSWCTCRSDADDGGVGMCRSRTTPWSR
jgi:hypothetical protein